MRGSINSLETRQVTTQTLSHIVLWAACTTTSESVLQAVINQSRATAPTFSQTVEVRRPCLAPSLELLHNDDGALQEPMVEYKFKD